MNIELDILQANWNKLDAAYGGFLASAYDKDCYGSITFRFADKEEVFSPVPILSFISAVSWHLSKALFSSRRTRVQLIEYPTLFDIEIVNGGKIHLYFDDTFYEYDLMEFCRSLGQVEVKILLDLIDSKSDFGVGWVALDHSFVKSLAYQSLSD